MQEITSEKELSAVLSANKKVLAFFYAGWCPFCTRFLPSFEKLAPKAAGLTPLLVAIDDEENPLWEKFSIEIVPTLIFFDNGKAAKRLDGRPGQGLGEAEFQQFIMQLEK